MYIWLEDKGTYKYEDKTKLTPTLEKKLDNLIKDPSWQLKGLYGAIRLINKARRWKYWYAKWFFYTKDSSIVFKIGELQKEGDLGVVKFKRLKDSDDWYQFIFYVNDFDNEEEVNAMANTLIKHFKPKEMFFKPDIYTAAGISKNNKLGILPWLCKYKDGRFIKIDI